MGVDSLKTAKIGKVVLTKKLCEEENEVIVARDRDAKTKLAEGRFISCNFNDQIVVHGGTSYELRDSDIVSTAHPSVYIILLLSGELEFSYDGLKFHLDAQEHPQGVVVNLLTPANFCRAIREHNQVSKLNIVLKPAWFNQRQQLKEYRDFFNRDRCYYKLSLDKPIALLLKQAISISTPSTFVEHMEFESLTHQIIAECLKQTPKLPLIASPSEESNSEIQVADIVSYIETHLDSNLSLEQLSQQFSMSISKLQRQFKQALNITVNGYIRFRRLEIAYNHLQRGLVSITEAAYEAGYQHPANFTHAFKREFGMTPHELVRRSH
ncbi:helix-turn-helix transcriptional regulator [Vibrio panuliri]|uniref:HTH araC/xylS-type domain-containing protein n=1 Tax=Vibrio panuliri TaxID=1381081 RepID=A0ABX3FF84_9VIBR|nr:AraC family transcriptional regulator [Vibrio panuliri]KAB1457373.1 helix-turn-helix transcriptional regulator [Vibrio panuliri]OLQ91467.1 hypothetical protein BIY20_01260 [Vibrio panuliri]